MKQRIQKATAIMLSALMLGFCLAGCGAQQEAKTPDAPAEADLVTEAAVSLLGSHSDTAGKEETVYVIADADGNPTETIVSAWLKNPDGADTLTDHAELTDIKNVRETRPSRSAKTVPSPGRQTAMTSTTRARLHSNCL